MSNVTDLFLKYVTFDTQADHDSPSFPSTKCQLAFAAFLGEECRRIGLSNVEVWEEGYVTAVLPSNTDKAAPVVGFIAHMDTCPDCSGKNVKPIVTPAYDGGTVQLPFVSISPEEFPILKNYIGQDIITSDGSTLLGADDKAGVAEILTAMEYLLQNPQIPHGTIKIAFTPDEEVGRGVDKFDTARFGADFAYTMDGGEIGELEWESFNAARFKIDITGKNIHPGYAKDVMINASLVAVEIAAALPADETPATTEGREGFFHLIRMRGNVENAQLDYIIRDFDRDSFNRRKDLVVDIVEKVNSKYEPNTVILNLYDEYHNMGEVLQDKSHIVKLAEDAMREAGVTPLIRPIRGGTDGSRLSFMNLPCPNLFAGGHNFHGPYEFVPVPSMEKAVEVIVNIAKNAVGAEM